MLFAHTARLHGYGDTPKVAIAAIETAVPKWPNELAEVAERQARLALTATPFGLIFRHIIQ